MGENEKNNVTFEDFFKQNERRFRYQRHRLRVEERHQDLYQDGLGPIWNSDRKCKPDKGPMATYFNYMIRNRIIDLIHKETSDKKKQAIVWQQQRLEPEDGNYYRSGSTINRHGMAQVAEDMGMYNSDWRRKW
ncbi:sigma factor [Lentibacillus salinarum]|uniref:Sigma factor n=1 Tax=Lentibacillus salinarum TaxID=446820 RepID=A0ABW3ZSH9_9BACI